MNVVIVQRQIFLKKQSIHQRQAAIKQTNALSAYTGNTFMSIRYEQVPSADCNTSELNNVKHSLIPSSKMMLQKSYVACVQET